jgi:aspartate/methionine/tyrosine aminotransferase
MARVSAGGMPISRRAASFTESVIREMTRLAERHGAVNLAQGFPDFDPPEAVLDAACRAVREGYNQYAITWGAPALRQAIARHFTFLSGIATDPETQITVTCGATEAMIAALMAVCDPGDEVIVLCPFYENYTPDCVLSGAVPRHVLLRETGAGVASERATWGIDPAELTAAFTPRTRAIIVNSPHNPTGHVFTRDELTRIADLCIRHDVLAITDEIYERILYDEREHVPIASLPGMAGRTITISGASKTFSVTGWRLGWTIAPPEITLGIRRVHDFLTVGAPHPLQMAAAAALALPTSYYEELVAAYTRRRERMVQIALAAGLQPLVPEGAYYLMADITPFGYPDDLTFTQMLVEQVGVAVVPASSFYPEGYAEGRERIRFAFPKRDATLDEAERRLVGRIPRWREG